MIDEFKDLKEVQMIVFKLGSEEYAVPITNVQEIIVKKAPTHIPQTASWVEGIINLRGRIISVINGKKKFSLPETTTNNANERIVVLDVESEVVGLIVDEVSEVIHLNTSDIEPPPVDLDDDSDFLWGVAKHNNRLVILINPKKFLAHADTVNMKKLIKVTESKAA